MLYKISKLHRVLVSRVCVGSSSCRSTGGDKSGSGRLVGFLYVRVCARPKPAKRELRQSET